jgi:hypothetical protein
LETCATFELADLGSCATQSMRPSTTGSGSSRIA